MMMVMMVVVVVVKVSVESAHHVAQFCYQHRHVGNVECASIAE